MNTYTNAGTYLNQPRRSPPACSVPLAVQRIGARQVGSGILLDRDGEPHEIWWADLGETVHLECSCTLDTYERASEPTLTVSLIDQETIVDASGIRKRRVPTFMQIDVVSRWAPLDLRIYTLRWDRAERAITMAAISHNAACEVWRSLYAPPDR